MGKNKLRKFADMARFECALQYPRQTVVAGDFPYRGKWNTGLFPNPSPITLELGCGKGEYTVDLALANADRNFIGVDIKGARMWTGARRVEEQNITNALFLRTEIELISQFFAPDEVSEIWITFPDPQMKKTRKRLTSTRFLNDYRKFLRPDGIIHLKTDSPFLYEYTRRLVVLNGFEVIRDTADLYGEGSEDPETAIKTFYETQWLARGKKIKLISFRLHNGELLEPETDDIPLDDYRAYPRGVADASRSDHDD